MPRIPKKEIEKYIEEYIAGNIFRPDAGETAKKLPAQKAEDDIVAVSGFIADRLKDLADAEEKALSEFRKKKYIKDDGSTSAPIDRKGSLCNIAVVAPVSAGKSTLLNALCEYPILPAASTVTSCTPTYITRAASPDKECIVVYPLKKIKFKNKDTEFIRYRRDESNRITFFSKDISKKIFDELLRYTILIMKGTGGEYLTTIETIGYFMASEQAAIAEYFGYDGEKTSVSDQEFLLRYDVPRHRFVLLMVLLCMYVDQNTKTENMTPYMKKINQMRRDLMKKIGLPVQSDYCVCLDWYSESIPEGATLIDLPGTGSDTQEIGGQSSHTALVKGILEDADALWVLCSDNGTVQEDLMTAIKDEVESNTDKSKVCIYNCKNENNNDSGPVKDFIERLPFLAGERCYVVNALAGEYKFVQNGIDIKKTKFYAKKMAYEGISVDIELLRKRFEDPKLFAATFPTYTPRIVDGKVQVTQDTGNKFTLSSFFRKALSDYVARLRYEVVTKDGVKQANFFVRIRDELSSSYSLLTAIQGKDEKIADAVRSALDVSFNQVCDDLAMTSLNKQREINAQLSVMAETIGAEINDAFSKDYETLIQSIHSLWGKLLLPNNMYSLEKNFFGNYIIRGDNERKINLVKDTCANKITVNSFSTAITIAKKGIEEYRKHLHEVIASLKKIVYDFTGNYAFCFFEEYDKQREEVCCKDGKIIFGDLYEEFNVTKEELKTVIEEKMTVLYKSICDSFEWLLDENGEFEKLVVSADKAFKGLLSDWILDRLRSDITGRYNGIRKKRIILNDTLDAKILNSLINDNFSDLKLDCQDNLEHAVNGIYGSNLSDGVVNFPSKISAMMNQLVSGISSGKDGAFAQIESNHIAICKLIDSATKQMMNVQSQLMDIKAAMAEWDRFGMGYCMLLEYMSESINKSIYDDYAKAVKRIRTAK